MTPGKKRILLIAERQLGEYTLKKILLREDIQIIAVLTDLSANEGKWWDGEYIPNICKKYKIPVFDSSDFSIFYKLIKLYSPPDMSIAVLNNRFIHENYLNWVNYKALNLHGAPLPEYQGNNCSHYAIINRDSKFGVTIYKTTTVSDQGPILYQKKFNIPEHCTNIQLYELTVQCGKELINEVIDKIVNFSFDEYYDINYINANLYGDISNRCIENNENLNVDTLERIVNSFYFPPFEPAYLINKGRKQYLFPENFLEYVNRFNPKSPWG